MEGRACRPSTEPDVSLLRDTGLLHDLRAPGRAGRPWGRDPPAHTFCTTAQSRPLTRTSVGVCSWRALSPRAVPLLSPTHPRQPLRRRSSSAAFRPVITSSLRAVTAQLTTCLSHLET